MPRPQILFDVTRLASRVGLAAPTGIDRVDLAYVQALADWSDCDLHLLLFDVWGPQLLAPAAAQALLAEAARRWQAPPTAHTPAFMALDRWLNASADAPLTAPRIQSPGRDSEPWTRAFGHLLRHSPGAARLRRLQDSGAPLVYINTSHGRLFRPVVGRWLQRSRAKAVFFVHDLIPIDYPQYNRPLEPARHAARLATIARHASAVITNSQATRESLLAYWRSIGVQPPPVDALLLGVGPAFTQPSLAWIAAGEPGFRNLEKAPGSPAAIQATSCPYFLVIGTLEPRKNHALLLDVWERLIADHGPSAPRLLCIGRRGWQNQALFDRLDASAGLAHHVAEVSGLDDAEVADLVRSARALLSPSFAEGYGLPVAEALAAGTPVLASDLRAHREVGGLAAQYLDPTDVDAWLQAVRGLLARDAGRTQALVEYRSPSWGAHFVALRERVRHIVTGAA